jgi:hypothetical protein
MINWDAVGAIGEIAGAATVIVTLVYLALQVKHATSVARASARQAVAQMNVDSLAASFDPHVLSLAAKKATLGEELTPDEHSNYVRWILLRMRVFENAHYQHKQGLLDEEEWTGYTVLILGLAGPASYAHEHWKWAAGSYSPSFVAEVERIMESVESISPVPSQGATVD